MTSVTALFSNFIMSNFMIFVYFTFDIINLQQKYSTTRLRYNLISAVVG